LRCLAVREAGETAAERAPGRTAADRLAPERPAALDRVCARARASAPLRWDEVEALPERLEHSPAQVLARLREYGDLFG
jgi:DNA primase